MYGVSMWMPLDMGEDMKVDIYFKHTRLFQFKICSVLEAVIYEAIGVDFNSQKQNIRI